MGIRLYDITLEEAQRQLERLESARDEIARRYGPGHQLVEHNAQVHEAQQLVARLSAQREKLPKPNARKRRSSSGSSAGGSSSSSGSSAGGSDSSSAGGSSSSSGNAGGSDAGE